MIKAKGGGGESDDGESDDGESNHIKEEGECSSDLSFESTDDFKIDHSDDQNGDYNDGNQPQASTNGTYSESLTRLQTGFLHAISVLEERNKALQNEVNDLRSRQDKINQPMARRLASVEQRNDKLEAELRAARMWPYTHKETQRNLELTLAKKNETIKEKNSKINDMEARIRGLEQELISERKKNKRLSAPGGMQNKVHVPTKKSTGTSGGTMTLEIRDRRDSLKAEELTEYPAMKKRKHEESKSGGSENPVVLD